MGTRPAVGPLGRVVQDHPLCTRLCLCKQSGKQWGTPPRLAGALAPIVVSDQALLLLRALLLLLVLLLPLRALLLLVLRRLVLRPLPLLALLLPLLLVGSLLRGLRGKPPQVWGKWPRGKPPQWQVRGKVLLRRWLRGYPLAPPLWLRGKPPQLWGYPLAPPLNGCGASRHCC